MKRVLVVDDEAKMRNLIRIYLQSAGFSVVEATDGQEALRQVEASRPHVVILDIMMPGLNGFYVCTRIRDMSASLPILMLTARTEVEDRVSGLTHGADDYLTKPFDGRELVARVHALLRRSAQEEDEQLAFDLMGLRIDVKGRSVAVDKSHVPLTPKEFDLLLELARHPGRTFSREELVDRIWSRDYEGADRAVDSHVKNIREKLRHAGLEPSPVKTVWGIGYRFEADS
ncbi:response regulator transcription factor [Alicyclobacillus sp. ALC3]|uniref:response regulator transcription factor n=1 Tax=Alicyclobacillus sp. ALC3 TaxID=2796143 RepID=UPI002377EEA9|nr:response regulator transcription factor [Alicyclobacillus sp. ALC3]WDL98804.1 response regulator transcription factor [Alicyclobacillus sp. ALC3]